MPRTVSKETLEKIEYVKQLHSENKKLTRRDLNAMVKKKFKTGLAFGHMANVLTGGRRKARGRRAAAPGRKPARSAAARRRRAGRIGGPGRMAGVSDRVFQGSPSFVLLIGGEKSLRVRTADSKARVKNEIARLVAGGLSPDQISVYSRDDFTVVSRPIVNLG